MIRLKQVFAILVLVIGLCSNKSAQSPASIPAEVEELLKKYLCVSCHKVNEKLIGPSYIELAQKRYSVREISALIMEPQSSNWEGYPPMPPMPHLPKEDVKKIAMWIKSLENKNQNEN